MLTRRRRAWTKDDVWALTSWLFVGQGLFILVGTTTFASILLLIMNGFQVQDWIGRRITKYFAKHLGLDVVIDEPILPNWKNGKLLLRNVRVKSIAGSVNEGYSLYDLTIGKAEVIISLKRFLEGRGLVVSCDVSGVRGTIDRRNVKADAFVGWRHQSQPNDFDIDQASFKDVLLNILNPDGFRTYAVSIISAELPRLRKGYLLYDFLGAESIVGMLDGGLFSMHIPQVTVAGSGVKEKCEKMRHLKVHSVNVDLLGAGATTGPLSWLTRGSVDMDVFIQLPSNYKNSGKDDILNKLGSMTSGAILQILKETSDLRVHGSSPDQPQLGTGEDGTLGSPLLLIEDLLKEVRGSLREVRNAFVGPYLHRLRKRFQENVLNYDDAALESPEEAALFFLRSKPDTISFKVDFCFHNIKARLPPHGDGGFFNRTLMRPLIAYINEQRPFIPISCHFDIGLNQMEGAWTVYESGIANAVSEGAAHSFERLVADKNRKMRRLKRVSLWSLYTMLRNLRQWMDEAEYGSSMPFLQPLV